MLDAYAGRSILLAATNHDGMLDSAVWRRFDEVLFLPPPTSAQLHRLLAVKLRGVRHDFDVEDVVQLGWLNGATHADVERVVRRAIKAWSSRAASRGCTCSTSKPPAGEFTRVAATDGAHRNRT